MTKFAFLLVDQTQKILPEMRPPFIDPVNTVGFSGDQVFVQLAYSCSNDDLGDSARGFFCHVVTDQPGATATASQVKLVPSSYPCHGTVDPGYLSTKAGLFPDLLVETTGVDEIKAAPFQWRTLLIRVDIPQMAQAGDYHLYIELLDKDGGDIQKLEWIYTVCATQLPKQDLIHTEWFHADCLADYYHVPVFSEKHWNIINNFMRSAHQHGINMLLTPLFTPPLDTAKGGERTTVQLVKVNKEVDIYHFDFSDLKRWIALCKKNNIEYLEMSHLFSQWGAQFAPKIMGTIDGGAYQRLFGWETPATSTEYTTFLHCFIPQLKEVLISESYFDHTWFHISDEPHDCEVDTYAKAKTSVEDLLSDCHVLDALSSYQIYSKGLVSHPVVSVDHIHTFLDAKVPNLWAYYCTCQAVDVPNRFMSMPNGRNRIIGTLLYYYNIRGFLHWGFNFYNSQCSVQHIDPYKMTDAGEAFPSGDAFLVYPAPDGNAYDSLRGINIEEALKDYRSLKLMESVTSRESVLQAIDNLIGYKIRFDKYPTSAQFFASLRNCVVKEVQKER